jgi:hypothetical protein
MTMSSFSYEDMVYVVVVVPNTINENTMGVIIYLVNFVIVDTCCCDYPCTFVDIALVCSTR